MTSAILIAGFIILLVGFGGALAIAIFLRFLFSIAASAMECSAEADGSDLDEYP